jgi:hypothetical protein
LPIHDIGIGDVVKGEIVNRPVTGVGRGAMAEIATRLPMADTTGGDTALEEAVAGTAVADTTPPLRVRHAAPALRVGYLMLY